MKFSLQGQYDLIRHFERPTLTGIDLWQGVGVLVPPRDVLLSIWIITV